MAEGAQEEGGEGGKEGGAAVGAGVGSEGGEYRLFEPLRSKVEAGSQEVCTFLSAAFGDYFASCGAQMPAANLCRQLVDQKLSLSMGLLNVLLSAVLVKSYLKNRDLKREMGKRDQYVERLINKLYEMQISFNSIQLAQSPLLY